MNLLGNAEGDIKLDRKMLSAFWLSNRYYSNIFGVVGH